MRSRLGTMVSAVLLAFIMVASAVPAPALSAVGRANATVTCEDPDREAEPGKNAQYNLSIALDGSGSAQITFSTRTPTGPIPLDWYVQLPYLWTLIQANENRSFRMNVTPPKNASVGEVLDVVLVMESADFPTGYINVSTRTTVALNYKFNLSIDNPQYLINPGTTANFNITVDNVGNGPFELDVGIPDPAPDSTYEFSTDHLTVLKGEQRVIALNVTFTRFAPTGWYHYYVQLTPTQAPLKNKEILAQAYVEILHVLEVEVDHQSISLSPMENGTFNFTVRNLSNEPEEIDIQCDCLRNGVEGKTNVSSTIVDVNGTDHVTMKVSASQKAKPGLYKLIFRADLHYGKYVIDTAVNVTIRPYYNFSVNMSHDEYYAYLGETIPIEFVVRNAGNVNDTYDVHLLPLLPYWNTSANMTVFVATGGFNYTDLFVTVPDHLMPMYLNTSMTVRSMTTNVTVTLPVSVKIEPTILWTFVSISDLSITVDPGETQQVLMYVENLGNVERPYGSQFNPTAFWYIESQWTFVLGPFENRTIPINFTADLYSPATKESLDIQFYSMDSDYEDWDLPFTLKVNSTYGVIVSAVSMPVDVYRGETLDLTFLISNTGNSYDDFSFNVIYPAGWMGPSLEDMHLIPFEGKTKHVLIDIPAKTKPGKYTVQLVVTSQMDPSMSKSVNVTIPVKKKPVYVNPVSSIGIYIFAAVLGMVALFAVVFAMLLRPPKPKRPKPRPDQGRQQQPVQGQAPPLQ